MAPYPSRPRNYPAKTLLVLEAAAALLAARLLVAVLPRAGLARLLGRAGAVTPPPAAFAAALVQRVAWALARARRPLPLRVTCLTAALAGRMLLARRGVPATLRLGVAKAPDGQLVAHAWLLVGQQVVCGRAEAARFQPIADFRAGP